jgi:dihydrodipicolinate synthase/N-acetylneuraminate lyase
MSTVHARRAALVETLFPGGIPGLWCPLLTHYTDDVTIDTVRMAAHIRHMRPWVSGFLAPGSTGDGWEMSPAESDSLVDFLLNEAERQRFSLMIGVLRLKGGTVVPAIRDVLNRYTDGSVEAAGLAARHIAGFTVTPPGGAELTQGEILAELEAIAATGAPISIYQLPQITQNEMTPETVSHLVRRYPNVYLLKDTSGADRVVLSGTDLDNLYLVRGAEGDYAGWVKSNGGYYDGFLLSTANSFAEPLATVLSLISDGKVAEAEELSGRISRVVGAVFDAAGALSFGNPFANANKAMDHFFAWGADAGGRTPPMTHSGHRLPGELLQTAEVELTREGFLPTEGYVDT